MKKQGVRQIRSHWYVASLGCIGSLDQDKTFFRAKGITDVTWGPSPLDPGTFVVVMFSPHARALSTWCKIVNRAGWLPLDQSIRPVGKKSNLIDWLVHKYKDNVPFVKAFQTNRLRIGQPHAAVEQQDRDSTSGVETESDVEATSIVQIPGAVSQTEPSPSEITSTLVALRSALGGIRTGPVLALDVAPLRAVEALLPAGMKDLVKVQWMADPQNPTGLFSRCPRYQVQNTPLALHRQVLLLEHCMAKLCSNMGPLLASSDADGLLLPAKMRIELEFLASLPLALGPDMWTSVPSSGGGVVRVSDVLASFFA